MDRVAEDEATGPCLRGVYMVIDYVCQVARSFVNSRFALLFPVWPSFSDSEPQIGG